jgi:ribosomal protein S4
MKNKNIYKPLYKNFIRLNKNVQSRLKFLSFKKQKWKKFISMENKLNKKITLFDHFINLKPKKYSFNFTNKFKFYLLLKQNFKLFYGSLSDNKFNQMYKKSKNVQKNNLFFNKNSFFLLFYIEKRLDVILFRTPFFDSIRSSQQSICHGKIYINGKKITINSHLIKKGDLIEIHSSFHKTLFSNIHFHQNKLIIPPYLEINYKTLQFFIISEISLNKISYNFPFWLNLNKLFLLHN